MGADPSWCRRAVSTPVGEERSRRRGSTMTPIPWGGISRTHGVRLVLSASVDIPSQNPCLPLAWVDYEVVRGVIGTPPAPGYVEFSNQPNAGTSARCPGPPESPRCDQPQRTAAIDYSAEHGAYSWQARMVAIYSTAHVTLNPYRYTCGPESLQYSSDWVLAPGPFPGGYGWYSFLPPNP
jgi:hypothetical protein